MVALLALGLALTWGYGQRRARLRLELQAENVHQAAFARLAGGVEALAEQLAVLEVVQSDRAWREGLATVRARALAAAEAVTGLPLPAQPLARSGAYLGRAATVAADLLRREAWDRAAVVDLRRGAEYLRAELAALADLTGSGRLRWAAAAAVAGPDGDGNGLTPINLAVQALEDGWPGAPAPAGSGTPGLPSPEAAARCAAAWLGRAFGNVGAPTALERDATAGLVYFSATTPAALQLRLAVDVACRAPYMLAFRPLGQPVLKREAASASALAAVDRLGLGQFQVTGYRATDGVALVTLAPVAAGRVYFDDTLYLRIARDNGEFLGLTGGAFFSHPRPRAVPGSDADGPPEAVRGVISAGADDVAVYRLLKRHETGAMYVYVGAASGEELRVERVSE